MKNSITKKKFCISVDIDVYDELVKICNVDDAKVSTRINSILRKYLKNEKK